MFHDFLTIMHGFCSGISRNVFKHKRAIFTHVPNGDPSHFDPLKNICVAVPIEPPMEPLVKPYKICIGPLVQELLINFLEQNLPKSKKKYQLGVYDSELGKDQAACVDA